MADTVSKLERSRIMALVKSMDTTPEMAVRRLVHALGGRYRLHDRSLPGKPDLVFPSRRKVIFVDGCFWHMHTCGRCRMPETRTEYWRGKLEGNRARDQRNRQALQRLGWRVMVIWECETTPKRRARLVSRIARFLGYEPATHHHLGARA